MPLQLYGENLSEWSRKRISISGPQLARDDEKWWWWSWGQREKIQRSTWIRRTSWIVVGFINVSSSSHLDFVYFSIHFTFGIQELVLGLGHDVLCVCHGCAIEGGEENDGCTCSQQSISIRQPSSTLLKVHNTHTGRYVTIMKAVVGLSQWTGR